MVYCKEPKLYEIHGKLQALIRNVIIFETIKKWGYHAKAMLFYLAFDGCFYFYLLY
mgnify:CR=1 FL=1